MGKVPTKVIADGRVTIPSDVRQRMNLKQGDYVLIEVEKIDE